MRLVLILIATLWAAGAVLTLVATRQKTLATRLTAGYLILWPVALVLAYLNQPLPLWIAVPVLFGFLPWFLAGPHLLSLLQDPTRAGPDELVGIPVAYWKWGGLAAVGLGLLGDWLLRP